MSAPSNSDRLVSLDALRGADMLCIVGVDQIVHAVMPPESWLHRQFTHVAWEGFHFYDLIFPLFLFLIGLSLPFSLVKRLERNGRGKVYRHIAMRAAVLLFFGMLINGKLFTYDPAQFQLTYSVLQVLALGYVVASLMVLHLSVRQQVVGTAALLVGYWLLMTFVPVPGHQVGVYAPGVNFGDWLNDQILGDWQKRWRFGWILQTMTYGANAMMGVLAGHVLRSRLERKTLALVAFGLAALIVGWVGGFSLPIIKNRWTSTFVLFACGWSLLLLAAFYWVIDVRGWRRWTLPLVVVGMNPITAYMAWGLFDDAFRMMAEVFLRGLQPHLGSAYDAVAWAGATFILWWILYAMYRQRIFLRA